MTPQEILALSEPVEAIYTDVTTQLIWNICKRLGQGKELKNWQAKKLGELDALTKDAVKIISNSTGKAQRTIKATLAKALGIELKDVEAILKGAVKAGKIPDIGFTVEQSQGLKQLLQSLSDQAVDQTNLVNTVMLNSTRQRYIWAVNNTVQEEQKLIQKLYSARDYDELEQQTAKVQKALNRAAGTVEAGAEARVQALSRTVKELAQEGITGYIDRGGHHWSPEAYVNMDIRTTVHNAAIQAQRTRAEEYGVETFQISSHAGARPLCAPYQGKFYSWDGSSGVLHDLYGKEYYYESIGNTSYGEPAGIFGINCGHNPQTFVDGYNIPRYEETKDAEANAAEYRESQKQRYYEREVRQAKLEAIAQDAAGNKDAFNQAAAKVRQANANYKEFCKETGRTPRPDRLQVYTSEQGNGFNRSMSGKVTGTTRGWTQTTPPSTPNEEGTKMLSSLYDRHTKENNLRRVEAAQANTLSFTVGADYKNLSEETTRVFNSTISGLAREYDTPLQKIRTMDAKEAALSSDTFARVFHTYETDAAEMVINPVKCKDTAKLVERISELSDKGYTVQVDKRNAAKYVPTHEFAHTLLNVQQPIKSFVGVDIGKYKSAQDEIRALWDSYSSEIGKLESAFKKAEMDFILGTGTREAALDAKSMLDAVKISKYSLSNADEFMAEAFTESRIGTKQSKYSNMVMSVLDKYFKR